MADINTLLLLLNDEGQVATIRASIVDLMFLLLDRQELLDSWEIAHLTDAVSALSLNVYSLQQPTSIWLRLCLRDLELALMPRTDRPTIDKIVPRPLDGAAYIKLRTAIEAIAVDIGHSSDPEK